MKRRYICLTLIAFGVASFALRVTSLFETSAVPTSYGVFVAWGADYIVRNGHFFTHTGDYFTHANPLVTSFNYASQDIFAHTFQAVLALVTGYTEPQERFELARVLLWAGVMLLPLVFIVWHTGLAQSQRIPTGWSVAFVTLLVLFPTANLIKRTSIGYHSGTIATALLWLILYLVLFRIPQERQGKISLRVATLLLVIGFQLYYHTFNIYFLTFLLGAWGILVLIRREVSWPLLNLITFNVVAFVTSLMYLNGVFFKSYASLAKRVLSSWEIAQVNLTGLTAIQGRLATTLNIVNTSTILLIVLTFVVLIAQKLRVTSLKNLPQGLQVVLSLLVSVTLLVPMLMAWDGFRGTYARLSAIGPYAAMLLASCLYIYGSKGYKMAVTTFIGVIVVTAAISAKISDVYSASYLEVSEVAGAKFLSSSARSDTPVFTDLRLGPPVVLFGHDNVRGIEAMYRKRSDSERYLDAIYYQKNDVELFTAAVQEAADTEDFYFLGSTTAEQTRLYDFSNVLPPPALGHIAFLKKTSPQLIYTNGTTVIVGHTGEEKRKDAFSVDTSFTNR